MAQQPFDIWLDSGPGRYTKDLVRDEDVVFPQPSHADTFDHMKCLFQSSTVSYRLRESRAHRWQCKLSAVTFVSVTNLWAANGRQYGCHDGWSRTSTSLVRFIQFQFRRRTPMISSRRIVSSPLFGEHCFLFPHMWCLIWCHHCHLRTFILRGRVRFLNHVPPTYDPFKFTRAYSFAVETRWSLFPGQGSVVYHMSV